MKRVMTADRALRWLIDFGSGWVPTHILSFSWANEDINWNVAWYDGYLEAEVNSEGVRNKYKLSDKAIKLIKENQNG